MDIIHPTCSKDQYSIIFEDYIDIQWVGLRENLNRKPCFPINYISWMCPVKIFPKTNPMIHTVTMDIIRNYTTTQTIHMGYIMKYQIMGEFLGMPTTAVYSIKKKMAI
jgi:hypothetical protein